MSASDMQTAPAAPVRGGARPANRTVRLPEPVYDDYEDDEVCGNFSIKTCTAFLLP
jgi:hypothetical protein